MRIGSNPARSSRFWAPHSMPVWSSLPPRVPTPLVPGRSRHARPPSTAARYPARDSRSGIDSTHRGSSSQPLREARARAVAHTSAEDELIPEAGGRSEERDRWAAVPAPKLRVRRSSTV